VLRALQAFNYSATPKLFYWQVRGLFNSLRLLHFLKQMSRLQKKANSSVHSAYAETRKFTALTVKKPKMQSWNNFGYKLNSSYLQSSKVLWQKIWRFRMQKLKLLDISKTT